MWFLLWGAMGLVKCLRACAEEACGFTAWFRCRNVHSNNLMPVVRRWTGLLLLCCSFRLCAKYKLNLSTFCRRSVGEAYIAGSRCLSQIKTPGLANVLIPLFCHLRIFRWIQYIYTLCPNRKHFRSIWILMVQTRDSSKPWFVSEALLLDRR